MKNCCQTSSHSAINERRDIVPTKMFLSAVLAVVPWMERRDEQIVDSFDEIEVIAMSEDPNPCWSSCALLVDSCFLSDPLGIKFIA